MKRVSVILSCWAVLIFGCGQFATPQGGGFSNDFDFNPGEPNPNDPVFAITQVLLNLFPTPAIPNQITIFGDFAYVVNSGANNIRRFDLANQADLGVFAVLPAGANPWEMAVSGNRGYVTNWVANNVSVLDMTTGGGPIATVQGNFASPEGVAISENGLVFVANVNLDFSSGSVEFGPGFVTVIDSATHQIVNEIPTTQKNPQVVVAVGNTVYVVNSGESLFDFGCFCFVPQTDGGVDIIDAATARNAGAPHDNIAIPLSNSFPARGLPGNLSVTPDNRYAYLGSNTGVLFKIDLLSRTLLRGNDNPIAVVNILDDNLLKVEIDAKGVIWVVSFNEDRLYLLNPQTDAADPNFISLNADPSALEGPLDIAFHQAGDFPDAYILMSISEEISAVFTN